MNIEEALDVYLEKIADAMINNLYENKSVASGDLGKSIKNNNYVKLTDEVIPQCLQCYGMEKL